jgi:phosphatidate cytidylyltransferase
LVDGDAGLSKRARIWIRLTVAPLLLLILLGVLWLHDGTGRPLATDVLLLVLGAAGAYEVARLFAQAGRAIVPWVATLAGGLLAGVGLLGGADAALRMELRVVILAAALVLLLVLHLKDTRPIAVDRIANTFVPILYVGLLLSFTRELGDGAQGARMYAWVALTAKASDMAGWIVGVPFGRHKMIPSVSPGKSWEGFAAGLVASAAVAAWLPGLLDLPVAAWGAPRLALLGLAIGGASILAGVTWSGWKRRLGTKDSSPLIPEIGGVMDLVDSMLLAAPVAWAWLRLGL